MTAPTLPWVQGAGLALLRADAAFMAACWGRLDSRPPEDVSTPYAVLWLAGNIPGDDGGATYLPLLQLSGWSPELTDRDVDGVVWTIAAEAARVFGSTEQARWRNFGYRPRLTDGPQFHAPDRSRGDANALYGAFMRAELDGQVF